MERKQPDNRKAEIISAAVAAAAEQGFNNITRRRVAELAGVTEPLVNHYVGSVDELKTIVIDEAIRLEHAEILAQLMAAKHPAARRVSDTLRRRVVDFMLLLGTVFTLGCGGVCVTETTRCNGERVEICNAAERWEAVIDCKQMNLGSWECVEPTTETDTAEDAACVEVTP